MAYCRASSFLPTNLSMLPNILSAFIFFGDSFMVLRVLCHFEKTLERMEDCGRKSITYSLNS